MPDARHSFAIVPHDVNDLPAPAKKIYVGAAGNLAIELAKDTSPITIAVTAGQLLEGLLVRKVLATGTTATGLIGFY